MRQSWNLELSSQGQRPKPAGWAFWLFSKNLLLIFYLHSSALQDFKYKSSHKGWQLLKNPLFLERARWRGSAFRSPFQPWEQPVVGLGHALQRSDSFHNDRNTNALIQGLEVSERRVALFIFLMIIMCWDYFPSRWSLFCPYLWSREESI